MTDSPPTSFPEPVAVPYPKPAAASDANGQPDPRIDAARDALRDVWDPELGLDVVSLGLVYDLRVTGNALDVDMTLTTPGCPVSESLPREAEAAVQAALPDCQVMVHVVWDPPWTPEKLSAEALESLGYQG